MGNEGCNSGGGAIYETESTSSSLTSLNNESELCCDELKLNGLNGTGHLSFPNGINLQLEAYVIDKLEDDSQHLSLVTRGTSGDFVDTPYVNARGEPLRKRKRIEPRAISESFEQCSIWDAFCTYLCYAVLVLVGYANDIIRPTASKERNREIGRASCRERV